jgi:hypothetical protein
MGSRIGESRGSPVLRASLRAPRLGAGVVLGVALVALSSALAIEVPLTQGQLTKEGLAAADAVYAGKAAAVLHEDGGRQPGGTASEKGTWRTIRFEVDHVIKGPPAKEGKVRFFVPDHQDLRLRFPPVPLDTRCLVVLRAEKGAVGSYRLSDPGEGVVLLAPMPVQRPREAASDVERAHVELLHAAKASDATIARPAIRSLGNLGVAIEETVKALIELSKGKDPEVAGTALATRMRLRDMSVTKDLLEFIRSGRAASVPRMDIILGMRQWTKPEDIGHLAEFLEAQDPFLRCEAVTTLTDIKDARTVPVLVRALRDPDLQVRYYAVHGLAERTGQKGEWSPGLEPFAKDPSYYTDRWRQWWQANKHRFSEVEGK